MQHHQPLVSSLRHVCCNVNVEHEAQTAQWLNAATLRHFANERIELRYACRQATSVSRKLRLKCERWVVVWRSVSRQRYLRVFPKTENASRVDAPSPLTKIGVEVVNALVPWQLLRDLLLVSKDIFYCEYSPNRKVTMFVRNCILVRCVI